ncbi:uncharacterized protein LOC122392532 isoform X2 [Amphibalanus amphitrite]|uniref:uncharacterized protein LOC122392532 isoform X2 n=1 Tax=Amphibalanus amphitrite TaxID=1232801 RepID=UPI001C915F04|nr:uncharacterized protein LOC122392532 isoform X2 [Amphibalanus amphitrite]
MTRRGLACCLVGVVAFLTCCVAQDAVTDEVAGADPHTTTESTSMGGDPFGPSDLSGPAGTATCRHWPSLQCSQLSCSGRGVIDCRDRESSVVRAVLLEQTQFPYLAGTVQAGSSSSCTLYNITCQPPVPLRANCTGISPVVCVDPPGKAGRDRSGVFHLVLQLLVGACVLFMPLIWIICRKQPNEVVANGNI